MTDLKKFIPDILECALASDKEGVARKKILQSAAFVLKEGVYETIRLGITDGGIAKEIGVDSDLVATITQTLKKEGKIVYIDDNPNRGWAKTK